MPDTRYEDIASVCNVAEAVTRRIGLCIDFLLYVMYNNDVCKTYGN